MMISLQRVRIPESCIVTAIAVALAGGSWALGAQETGDPRPGESAPAQTEQKKPETEETTDAPVDEKVEHDENGVAGRFWGGAGRQQQRGRERPDRGAQGPRPRPRGH